MHANYSNQVCDDIYVEMELARQRELVERQREEEHLREEVAREREATTCDQEAVRLYIALIAQAMSAYNIRIPEPSSDL
ncbi:hypothetical protein C1H46_004925 [Malus baccata]|uniref:Uncharacterized protein n=1 Tax=Malus baccata TaxID=106549 RepID=A0A540NEI9_MALBA|nr:hypothetical protein C1H46_004925 [Malus baccata]